MVRRPSVGVRRPPFSKIFSITAWLIKAKFHMEPQWDGGMKVCLRGLGHMTKMAATPIYGKNPSRIFSRTERANDLVAWYVALGTRAHHSCSNDDSRLTLTYFTARSNSVPYAFIWGKTVRKSFKGRNLQQMTTVTKCLC